MADMGAIQRRLQGMQKKQGLQKKALKGMRNIQDRPNYGFQPIKGGKNLPNIGSPGQSINKFNKRRKRQATMEPNRTLMRGVKWGG